MGNVFKFISFKSLFILNSKSVWAMYSMYSNLLVIRIAFCCYTLILFSLEELPILKDNIASVVVLKSKNNLSDGRSIDLNCMY